MHHHRLIDAARTVAAAACILLALAAPAAAMPADNGPPTTRNATPTVVRETVVRPGVGGPSTLGFVLIGVGAAAALLGAGYLGARIATRDGHPRVGRPV